MRKTYLVILIAILFLLQGMVTETLSKPTSTYDGIILSLPVTAYNAALSSANSSFSDDINSLTSNPAGLASLNYKSMLFSHFSHFQNINTEYAAAVIPIKKTNANIGFDLTFFNSGSIEKSYIDSNGNPIKSGTYKNYDKMIGFYYAMNFKEEFNVGAGMKFIDSKLGEVSAQTLRGSLGLQKYFQTSENSKIAFSANIRNFGSELKFDQEKNKPKEIYRIGAGVILDLSLNKIKTGVDIEYVTDDKINYYAAIDILLAKILSLRGGYDSRNDAGNNFSLGLGLNINSSTVEKGINIDYSYTPYGDLGNSHRFSLSFEFGKHKNSSHDVLPIEHLLQMYKPQVQYQNNYYNQNNTIQKKSEYIKPDKNIPANNIFQKKSNKSDLSPTQLFNKILMLIMSGDLNEAQRLLNIDFSNQRLLAPNKFLMLNNMIIERKK
ncbi:PorV/PorQ family protein [Candidatus Dependentiae bacterium]|nr:PorV/PorQ family protein [Candidatus Dependentiae bacterium]